MSLSRLFLRSAARRVEVLAAVLTMLFLAAPLGFSQTELATVFGRITDQSGAVVHGAEVEIRNVETNTVYNATTNIDGLYSMPSLHPGHYVISVRKAGFRTVSATGVELNVQDNMVRNFALQIGSASESVTVTADAAKINTTDATVSTVVDRQFAENLPMNGRSFQSLIQLTPGVVLTPSSYTDSGQFSVNGQRASSNYWMVDGVGANIGIGANQNGNPGNGLAGSVGSFSAVGGTNSLVSVDALQEFRIQTSTYAPEFGRTPGGQISILTRSGTNQFHGTGFDYLRNDALDANDWFADNAGLPKPRERQNDFGGTFSGPIFKDRTFFFFSYEGLRLRLPEVELTTVPDLSSRQNAMPALQAYLNAFPLPNGPEQGNGIAAFNASFANNSTLDAYSLRVDHRLRHNLTLFARYNYSPSSLLQRGFNGQEFLSVVSPANINTQTATAGNTWMLTPSLVNDFRFNFSQANASGSSHLDNFGGAVPLTSTPIPQPYTDQNAQFIFSIFSLQGGNGSGLAIGKNLHFIQRQVNAVDTLSLQKGTHSLKFGFDFRRLSPLFDPAQYSQVVYFSDVPSAQSGTLFFSNLVASRGATLLFRNLGAYAQDTWRLISRVTLTYGLRWDVDFSPSSVNGPTIAAVTNFGDLPNLALAPAGTPVFSTRYGNVAPRIGVAYQLSQDADWQTVMRGGFGVFFDLATQEIGNGVFSFNFPFGSSSFMSGGTFPLTNPAPPPISSGSAFLAVDPKLRLPHTLQWNFALEQGLGKQQSLTASYIGAAARRLIQTEYIFNLNAAFPTADILTNAAASNYQAMQVQFQRRLSRGLQALASYTWAHSIDDASSGSYGNNSNTFLPSSIAASNRGSSDFDIRHAFSAGVTYTIPALESSQLTARLLSGWSIENVIQARSAPPVTLNDVHYFGEFNGGFYAAVRPDLVRGQPLYLYGSQYPGGKAFNANAFTSAPADPSGFPLRQGNLPRNFLRAFGSSQWDFAVHRDFSIYEALRLQFRAEMFNVLNHPNFGPQNNLFGAGGFGVATQMLGRSLSGFGAAGNGGFNPLYQMGGPRSVQLALKLIF
jgi:hypothetical protein